MDPRDEDGEIPINDSDGAEMLEVARAEEVRTLYFLWPLTSVGYFDRYARLGVRFSSPANFNLYIAFCSDSLFFASSSFTASLFDVTEGNGHDGALKRRNAAVSRSEDVHVLSLCSRAHHCGSLELKDREVHNGELPHPTDCTR